MAQLILLRHGESVWNSKNLFTGWVDVPLSQKGIKEAIRAGKEIAEFPIDIIFCSTLVRGIMTAMLAMAHHTSGKTPVVVHDKGQLKEWGKIHSEESVAMTIPVLCNDALNERMYGDLQGFNKEATREKYGVEQVKLWRRSYATPPPHGESLEMTAERSIPFFKEQIVPYLQRGNNVFVSAHGNSLRSIIKYLDRLSDEEVINLELATGVPVIYRFEEGSFIKS